MTAPARPPPTAHGRTIEVAVQPPRQAGRTSGPLRLAPPSRPDADRDRRPAAAWEPVDAAAGQARSPSADLEVRLHTPLADVVVVRVIGALDEHGVGLLVERVGQQLDRAVNVVVDLGEVPILCPCGVRAVNDLHRQADARGVRLHVTGDVRDATGTPLRRADLDGVLDPAGSADALIALLALRRRDTGCTDPP